MSKIIIIIVIVLSNFLISPFSLAISTETTIKQEEILFKTKANLVIDRMAEETAVPTQGDIEKYVFPQIIAHLAKDQNDEWARINLEKFTSKLEENFYTNRDAFASPGITRILYLYADNSFVQKSRENYLNYINPEKVTKKNYNFWTTGGTENFVNMLRTSGYLLADLGINQGKNVFIKEKNNLENWINDQAKKIYEVGTAEWDSSTYTTFNLIGWLNLYDFAEDSNIKKIAQAVLDYYSAAMALKYSYGIHGGAEQRGGGANSSFNSIIDYLNWLWFSKYIPEDKNFFKWPGYLPIIHAATSTYRPPIEAIILARKENNYDEYYRNAKANYDVKKVENPEFFYIADNYTLGTVISASGEQLVNWKLVTFDRDNELNSRIVTGGNSYYQDDFNGVGKTIFDTYFQDKNILIQLTYIPDNVAKKIHRQHLYNWLKSILNFVKCGNSCQYILQNKLNNLISPEIYPIANQGKNPVSNYLSFPAEVDLINYQDKIYFAELNQDVYLAIYPINKNFNNIEKLLNRNRNKSRLILKNNEKLGYLVGFIVEVGEKTSDQNFDNFKTKIINKTKPNTNLTKKGIIEYITSDGRKIKLEYQVNNFLPKVWINQQKLNLKPQLYKIYDGKSLTVKNFVLILKSPESVYEINYQGNSPKFKRYSTKN